MEEEPLEAIYAAYSPELYRYAYRLIGDTQVAEDLVAATFYRFLRALHASRGPSKHLRAYLYRIAHNLTMDHYRRQPARVVSSDDVSKNIPSESNPAKEIDKTFSFDIDFTYDPDTDTLIDSLDVL